MNNKYVIRIDKFSILLFFLIIPHLKPPYFRQLFLLDNLFDGWRLLSFIIILFLAISERVITRITVLLIIMESYVVVNTIIHSGDIHSAVLEAFSVISIAFIYEYSIYKNIDALITVLLFCFEILVMANLISEILFPNGLYLELSEMGKKSANWLLGYYNSHTQYYIPAIVVSLLYAEKTGKYKRTIILMAVIIFSSLIVLSAGVIISLALMFFVFVFLRKFTGFFNYYTYWITQVAFLLFVIIQQRFERFGGLLTLVGKISSLTGRIPIWNKELVYINNSLITGYGIVSSDIRRAELGGAHWARYAHNLILEIMYNGGLIYITLFTLVIIVAGVNLWRERTNIIAQIISIGFMGWCIQSYVDAFITPFLVGMFVIAYHYFDFKNYSLRQENLASVFLNEQDNRRRK